MKPKPSELRFKTLCDFFDLCVKRKKPAQKKQLLRDFADKFIERGSSDVYEIYRLLAPALDKERDHYNLRESNLVKVLIKACLLDPKTSSAAKRAENWRQAGVKNAGQFSNVMEEYLFRTCCGRQSGMHGEAELTVGELNDILNKIANASGEEQVKLFTYLIQNTTALQMRWIVQIILRDLKIGLSETSILAAYHQDAVERYNVTCDFPGVIRELTDPHKRFPFQDIKVGKPAKPQLARAVKGPEEAYNIMKGRNFVVETKFDGERMQVHVTKDEVRYYSRRGIEHGTYSSYTMLDSFIRKQLRETDVILDGEVVVWNKTKKKFEPFGGMKSAVLAARDNRGPDELLEMNGWHGDTMTSDPDYETPFVKDLELVFVVFDVLYLRDQSVINRTLLERHDLLKEAVIPAPPEGHPVSSAMTGRMVCLLPGVPLMTGVPGSKLSCSLEDIQEKFEESIRVNEEGILVKAANSAWRCNDRGLNWLKIKADYVHKVEIDAVIIGARFGTGRRGGAIAEYLLALAEVPQGGASEPSTFVSFCMVGTGVNDAERDTLAKRLEPWFVDNVKGKNCVPRCYRTTGMPKERPDVWIKDPTRSVVLQVQADVRTIVSKTFASRHSLRFPRVQRVRWDKSPMDIQTDQELWDIVESNQGAIVGGDDRDADGKGKSKGKGKRRSTGKAAEAPAQQRSKVVSQFLPTDVSHIRKECDALKDCLVFFVPAPEKTAKYKKVFLEELVASLGGKVTQNYVGRVSHVIAQAARGPFFEARKDKVDMISVDWLLECARQQTLVPLRPHHFMHLTHNTRMNVPNVCKYGDMYYEDVSAVDVKVILNNHAQLQTGDVERLAAVLEERANESPLGVANLSMTGTVNGCIKPKRNPGMEDIMLAVDRELAEHGLLDPSTCLFRGCHICILQLPDETCPPQEVEGPRLLSCAYAIREGAAAAKRDLAALQVQRMKLEVRLHGGKVQDAIDMSTTHIVMIPPANCQMPALSPADLLQHLHRDMGSTAGLTALHKLLAAGQVHIVQRSWLQESLEALKQDADGDMVRRASELRHALLLSAPSGPNITAGTTESLPDINEWGWEAFGVSTAPTPPLSKTKTKRGRSASPSDASGGGRPKRGRGSRGGKSGRASRASGRAAKAQKPPPLAPAAGGRTRRGGGRGRGRGRGRSRAKYAIDDTSSDDDAPGSMPSGGSDADDDAEVDEQMPQASEQQKVPIKGEQQSTSMLKDLLSLPMAGVNDSLSLAHPPDADSAPQHHGTLDTGTRSHTLHCGNDGGQEPSQKPHALVHDASVSLEAPLVHPAAPKAQTEVEPAAFALQSTAAAPAGPRLSLKERVALAAKKRQQLG